MTFRLKFFPKDYNILTYRTKNGNNIANKVLKYATSLNYFHKVTTNLYRFVGGAEPRDNDALEEKFLKCLDEPNDKGIYPLKRIQTYEDFENFLEE